MAKNKQQLLEKNTDLFIKVIPNYTCQQANFRSNQIKILNEQNLHRNIFCLMLKF